MQNVVYTKPYRFVPPHYSPFWAQVVHWILPMYLRRSDGITSWEFHGVEKLRASIEAGAGVMLAPNHCRPCDPMVMALLTHETGRPCHIMASSHLFMKGGWMPFLLPRIGAFSVYREGMDRDSLKCATAILTEARHPLVVFPEGFITRNNDRLMNLMDGVAFMARTAAKQRASAPGGGKVVVHPVFIRYFFNGDIAAATEPVLEEIEKRLSWQPQKQLPLLERIIKAGHALLALKEIEYFGTFQSGDASERLARLLDRLLEPLEQEWTGGTREPDTMARVKRLRTAILPDMVHGELSEEEMARRWRQLNDLYLAQQLKCYSGDYLSGTPTPERMLETIERYEEDLTDVAHGHPPVHAAIFVGDAIEVPTVRDRSGNGDPVTNEMRRQMEAMLEESQAHRPK